MAYQRAQSMDVAAHPVAGINNRKAAGYVFIAAVALTLSLALIKKLTHGLSVPVIALGRHAFAVLCFIPFLGFRLSETLHTSQLGMHVSRATISFAGYICFIEAVKYLPLGDATALTYTSPFWSMILSVIWLRERPTIGCVVAAILGYAGVLLIAQPDGTVSIGTALAITTALLTSRP